MVFSSYTFILIFLPIVLINFYIIKSLKIKHSFTYAKLFLILSSLFFYSYWKIEYLPILLVSIIINYYIAKNIIYYRYSHEHLHALHRSKILLIIGIAFNVALLGFFKYTDFFLENLSLFAKLVELDIDTPLPHILLPLALSFVTFQQIAFLCDCYKGDKIRIDIIDYCLFITFFPQLIAGPIVHHKEMMGQFANSLGTKRLFICASRGLFIFSIGLFKKVFIADSFAKWANAGFSVVESGDILNFFESWATSLSYTFQLYFDFSGYCDMAIGLALFFGILLPINFNSPYKALNIADFWRRWHITLGRFLKEYLYIPLGGNRGGTNNCNIVATRLLTIRNLFLVAFISGIWHGAGFGFIIWGVLHGIAMCLHRIYAWTINSLIHSKAQESKNTPKIARYIYRNTNILESILHSRFYKCLAWFITFNFINIAWIFFRSNNIQGALNLIKSMLGIQWIELPANARLIPHFLVNIGGKNDTLIYIVLAFIVVLYLQNSKDLLSCFKPNTRFTILTMLFLHISMFAIGFNPYQEFIYFNF